MQQGLVALKEPTSSGTEEAIELSRGRPESKGDSVVEGQPVLYTRPYRTIRPYAIRAVSERRSVEPEAEQCTAEQLGRAFPADRQ
jgi:hypothetical protein